MGRYYQGGRIGGDPSYPLSASGSGIWTPMDMRDAITGRIDTANPGYPQYVNYPNLTDSNFSSVKVLWHGDELIGVSNAGCYLRDYSGNACHGKQSGSSATNPSGGMPSDVVTKFGRYSTVIGQNSGSGYGIRTASNTTSLGTGDFTLECWAYWVNNSNDGVLFDWRPIPASGNGPIMFAATTNKCLTYQNDSVGTKKISGTTNGFSATTWHHCAVNRQSGTVWLYLDGVSQGSVADSTNFTNVTFSCGTIGTAAIFLGYMAEMRYTSGVARYPSGTTFSVPTAPFPDY